eukprot:GEMP01023721.1.p1 GENE.GEMP01023721.1~~GEMP01023721.1.p1  ORF type:complete len:414 (+),score=31.09 GEMP01023721.1:293-1534(+)
MIGGNLAVPQHAVTIHRRNDGNILQATVIVILIYNAFCFDEGETVRTRILKALAGASISFVALGMLALPSGPFVRPHPCVWRFVLAVSILYWLMLVAILFQDYVDLRVFLGVGFPDLKPDRTSGPLPWTKIDYLDADTYAQDCSFTYKNVSQRFDIFILAHFLGWFWKAMMLRSYAISIITSIWWECSEMFFATLLPNFNECWWDQILLDVCIFNMLGIVAGIQLCRYFEVRVYHWRSFRELPTTGMKVKRAIQQFTPQAWTIVRWTPLRSMKRYFQVILIIVFLNFADVNCFFLKSTFEIRIDHPLIIGRIFLWAAIGMPSLRQAYVFMSDPSCVRLGTHAWVCFAMMVTECLIWLKFGFFRPGAPWDIRLFSKILVAWTLSLFLFTFICLWIAKKIENIAFFKRLWATKFD